MNIDESMKKMETLDNGYLWEMCQHECRMMIPTRGCHDEEPSSKVQLDLMLCFDFLNNIQTSACKAIGTRVVSTSTTGIHVVDGIPERRMMGKKQLYDKGSRYVSRRPLSIKKGMTWRTKKESD